MQLTIDQSLEIIRKALTRYYMFAEEPVKNIWTAYGTIEKALKNKKESESKSDNKTN